MTIEHAAAWLRQFDHIAIASHDGPDADGLGAAYALAVILEAIGKDVRIIYAESLPAKLLHLDKRGIFSRGPVVDSLPFDPARSCAIVVDTHDLDFVGEKAAAVIRQAAGLFFLDHHELKAVVSGEQHIDPSASSTCELVFRLAKCLQVELPLDAAEAVFEGIVYDTGSFAYPKTSADTFACAAELVRRGVRPYEMHGRIYESATAKALLLQKLVLGSLELLMEDRLAIQLLRQADLAQAGASYEDAEDFVNIPLMGAPILVSVLMKEKAAGKWRCSMRSKGEVNVARIAQDFGGGGHRTAAGFTSDLPLPQIRSSLIASVQSQLAAGASKAESHS